MQGGQGALTPWQSYNFAADWYADAKREAEIHDQLARRREILFAVACIESYLVEWVRDDVLKHEHQWLVHYFPPPDQTRGYRSIEEKWKEVPKQLMSDGRIPAALDLGRSSVWPDFQTLVAYRNALVHGRTSRPDTPALADNHRSLPLVEALRKLPAGWACDVARRSIQELNAAAKLPTPSWVAP